MDLTYNHRDSEALLTYRKLRIIWRNLMKTYSVKEVRDITGLTWKQLYEYKVGIPGIGPMNDAGYKQYSKEDLEKLVQAALMAKLGAKPKDINKAFSDEKYDRKKVIKELHDRAKRRLVEAQDIMTVIENLLPLSNATEVINSYAIRDLHTLAENFRNLLKDEDTLLFEKYIEKKGWDGLFEEIGKLKDLEEDDIGKEKSYSPVLNLKKFGEETIGMAGNRFLMFIASSLFASDYVRKRVENAFGQGKADIISKVILEYMGKAFSKESDGAMDQLFEYIGRDYDDEEVKTYIENLKNSFMKNFGLKTTYEFLRNIEHLKYIFRIDENLSDDEVIKIVDEAINYVVGAVEHYEKTFIS